jgi:uncharacterized protein (TIGR03086 family)
MEALNRSFTSTRAILAKVQPGDLDAATPCASWEVSALVNHFVGTARWWASIVTAAGAGGGADVDYAAGDFVSAYEESIGIATSAFEAEGVLDETFRLDLGEFSGAALLGLAATEQFTHGWDLARAIGYHTDLDPELAAELLTGARLAVTDAYRGPDGVALFGPATQAPAGASPADELAAFLGRRV